MTWATLPQFADQPMVRRRLKGHQPLLRMLPHPFTLLPNLYLIVLFSIAPTGVALGYGAVHVIKGHGERYKQSKRTSAGEAVGCPWPALHSTAQRPEQCRVHCTTMCLDNLSAHPCSVVTGSEKWLDVRVFDSTEACLTNAQRQGYQARRLVGRSAAALAASPAAAAGGSGTTAAGPRLYTNPLFS